jgi:hypothetical protein
LQRFVSPRGARQNLFEIIHQRNSKNLRAKRLIDSSPHKVEQGVTRSEIKMQAVLEQNYIADALINRSSEAFGNKIGIIAKVFGCWLKELSRPFTDKYI